LSKLRPVSHNELIRGLRAFGFEGPLSGGKHLYMLRGNLRLTIPNPHKQKEGRGRSINKNTPTGGNNKRRVDGEGIVKVKRRFALV